jgi:hypothetical protein
VWTVVLQRFGWEARVPAPDASFVDWWLSARKLVVKRQRKAFDSVVLLVARGIWLQRNCRVFDRRSLLPVPLAEQLQEQCEDWCRVSLICSSQLARE